LVELPLLVRDTARKPQPSHGIEIPVDWRVGTTRGAVGIDRHERSAAKELELVVQCSFRRGNRRFHATRTAATERPDAVRAQRAVPARVGQPARPPRFRDPTRTAARAPKQAFEHYATGFRALMIRFQPMNFPSSATGTRASNRGTSSGTI